MAAQIEALIELRVPAFSFVFGVPDRTVLAECRRRSIVTIGAATTADEATALEAAGVDVVVASGFEAGGHRPSFLRSADSSLTGLFALVPQVVKVQVGNAEDAARFFEVFGDGLHVHRDDALPSARLPLDDSPCVTEHRHSLVIPHLVARVLPVPSLLISIFSVYGPPPSSWRALQNRTRCCGVNDSAIIAPRCSSR